MIKMLMALIVVLCLLSLATMLSNQKIVEALSPEIAYVKKRTTALNTLEERLDNAKITMYWAMSEKCGIAPSDAVMTNAAVLLAINHIATEEFLTSDIDRYARNIASRVRCIN